MLVKIGEEVVCDCTAGEYGNYHSLLSNHQYGWVCESPFGPCIYSNEQYTAVLYSEDHHEEDHIDGAILMEMQAAGAEYSVNGEEEKNTEIKETQIHLNQEQKAALLALAQAYTDLSGVWDSTWEGPENFGGVLDDLGLLPKRSLDEAGSELLHLVDSAD